MLLVFQLRVLEMARQREPIILFDGVCNLCSGVVQWVIAHDPLATFRFAPLQSEAARHELAKFDGEIDLDALSDSLLLIDDDGVHAQSTATLRVARHLKFPYSLFAVGMIVPRSVRDAVYRILARHRYRWFGRRDTCLMPSPEIRWRFLDVAREFRPSSSPQSHDLPIAGSTNRRLG